MSFFFDTPTQQQATPSSSAAAGELHSIQREQVYHELINQRPALLDEKLKLHARIIDEFNLVSLERLPREDLIREVRTYLGDYVRNERLTLNQKEL